MSQIHFSHFAGFAWLIWASAGPVLAQGLDGRTASRWRARPTWMPGHEAKKFSVENERGWLAFNVMEKGKKMTWTLQPTASELAGEPRYLVLRYRARGLTINHGDYLIVLRDGSPEWRRGLGQNELVRDGQEHVLAIDLLSYCPPAPLDRLAIRVGPPEGDRGTLLARIELSDKLPAGTSPNKFAWPEKKQVRFDFENITWRPSPGWISQKPDRHEMNMTGQGIRYSMQGERKAMRWSARIPREVNMREMPFVSVRYRARGKFGPSGYVFYLAVQEAEGERWSEYALKPRDLDADGRWHVHHALLARKGIARGSVAVGIDSLSPEAEIELDYIEFSTSPPTTPLSEVLAYEPRKTAWAPWKKDFKTLPLPEVRARAPFMRQRLGIGDWFKTSMITAQGIPFRVPETFGAMPRTGTPEAEDLEIPLKDSAAEILVLLAAAYPRGARFGNNWRSFTPLRVLDEPERASFELVYADGTSDEIIPVRVWMPEYGIFHDFDIYALQADPGKKAVKLVLHDRMGSAGFGIAGLTLNRGRARARLPEIHHLWYSLERKPEAADAEFTFLREPGLAWGKIRSGMLGGREIDLTGSAVFRLQIGRKIIPSSLFGPVEFLRIGRTELYRAGFSEDGLSLQAELTVGKKERRRIQLSLRLVNTSRTPVTGALFFPAMSGLKVGDLGNTWYFSARRGGVINRLPCRFRDEIGEGHPLQVDGFFNPAIGAGLTLMPRDREGLFRWYRLSKNARGCRYELEYLPQTVAPEESWDCATVVVSVVPGDWRDQFNEYLQWVRTWYEPLAPRKKWFQNVFSFPTHYPGPGQAISFEERTDLRGLVRRREAAMPGATDYLHLFGWAKTERFGHWGDYDHFEQLGGKERFIREIRRCQQAGVPAGLYLDCYLVSSKSRNLSKQQLESWGVRDSVGKMLPYPRTVAYSMCPEVKPWRDYLAGVYTRLARDLKPDGMYLDEFGKCMTTRICYSPNHGHRVPVGMCRGEWAMTRQIRKAIPPEIATYCEYVPADVATQYLDGAFGHVALYGYRDGFERTAPHYVNLHRFAFPDFKHFELIYYVPLQNGNWFLHRYPFFNGDGYYLTQAASFEERWDPASRSFLVKALKVLHKHRDAFTSPEVEPLVRTEIRGVYANRFSASNETVWTLFNANYRTARGPVLRVNHEPAATYRDAWQEKDIRADLEGRVAALSLVLPPRSVGCVVQLLRK